MTIKTINIGTNPNDNTGEGLRDGLKKVNDNFTDSANAASKLMATNQQALDGTAGVVPDAEQVHAAFNQYGLGQDFGVSVTQSQIDTWDALKCGTYRLGNPTGLPGGTYIVDVRPALGHNGCTQLLFGINQTIPKYYFRTLKDGQTPPSWNEIYTTDNTTVDSNGFIKSASPIVNLFDDQLTGNAVDGVTLTKTETGVYTLSNVEPLAESGWYIETPKDRNANIYFTLDYEQDTDAKTLTIRTYTPDYSTGPATNGAPVDILPDRFVALRFNEPPAPELPEPVETEEE